jgi:hypothetical protein
MSRFKITVRGDQIELRGYANPADGTYLQSLALAMEPFGIVVASIAEDIYDPFAISEPEYPPTEEGSRQVITGMMEGADAPTFIDRMVQLHHMQAVVIRNERALREQAEAELRDRELHHFEAEQENEALRATHNANVSKSRGFIPPGAH